jgi:hypothetical protein
MIYGTASYYGHLRFEPPADEGQTAALAARRPAESTFLAGLDAALAGGAARRSGGKIRKNPASGEARA